jgi:L-threonylcarbamoyladenylate synthase
MTVNEEIEKCLEVLRAGGIILYPTDTVWGIGCDASNEQAVEKIYRLKKRSEAKTMICLVSRDSMLERHVEKVPDLAYDLIDMSEKPITIVYDRPKGIAKNIVAADDTLAIRVARDEFCKRLIDKLNNPLVSTSANLADAPTPGSFPEISDYILKGVDYVVNLYRRETNPTPSSIIKLSEDGTVTVIRE